MHQARPHLFLPEEEVAEWHVDDKPVSKLSGESVHLRAHSDDLEGSLHPWI